MSKKSKRAKKKRNSTGSKPQQESTLTAPARRWWWIGGVAALLLVAAVALGCTVGLGQPESPASTSTEKETISMPTNPADRNNMYSAMPETQIDLNKTYVATISTAKGDISFNSTSAPPRSPSTISSFCRSRVSTTA